MEGLFLNKEEKLKSVASAYYMFSLIADQDFKDEVNSFLFNLRNLNTDLEFEPQEYPHITLFTTPSSLDYPTKMEMTSFIRRVIPRDCGTLDLEILGVDFFGDDKLTLVLRVGSEELHKINSKIREFTKERGLEQSHYDFNPHMTLGRVNKNKLYIPPVPRLNFKISDLRLSIRD